MKIGSGVEWAAHACIILAPLTEGHGLRAAKLAEYLEVPAAYMAKQLQLLSAAGLVTSVRGPKGGYCLARAPQDISLWDIHAAIEGRQGFFRCTEVRQRGPCAVPARDCRAPCGIAGAYARAQSAFRDELKTVTVDMLVESARRAASGPLADTVLAWYADAVKPR